MSDKREPPISSKGPPSPLASATTAKPPKGRSGEHPALAAAVRQLEETERLFLPELQRATDRFSSAMDSRTDPPPPVSSPTIGDWVLVVRGRGAHHNGDPLDVDRTAASFVLGLRSSGHDVRSAEVAFDDGTVEDVSSAPETLRSKKEDKP